MHTLEIKMEKLKVFTIYGYFTLLFLKLIVVVPAGAHPLL